MNDKSCDLNADLRRATSAHYVQVKTGHIRILLEMVTLDRICLGLAI